MLSNIKQRLVLMLSLVCLLAGGTQVATHQLYT